MKKFLALVFAAMMIFSAQINFVQAAEMGEPATPIESSRVYPKDIEKDLNYRGTVMISATVNAEGKVIKTVIMRSSGRPKVDKIAMEAAAKWEFKPAVDKEGNPMEVWYMIRFDPKDF